MTEDKFVHPELQGDVNIWASGTGCRWLNEREIAVKIEATMIEIAHATSRLASPI